MLRESIISEEDREGGKSVCLFHDKMLHKQVTESLKQESRSHAGIDSRASALAEKELTLKVGRFQKKYNYFQV